MKYMGSKSRIAKHILPIMLREMEEKGYKTWVEPFVGGGNVIDKVPHHYNRIGADLNPHAIAALTAIRDLVDTLPNSVSDEFYTSLKGSDPDPITSWIRFVCSFSGKFESGFARHGLAAEARGRSSPCEEGKRNAVKQSPKLDGTTLINCQYNELSEIVDSVIYCDPPYQCATGYNTGSFNHEEFFDWCRKMKSRNNSVFVSEYNAPDDFELVWQGEIKTNFSSQRKQATHKAVEKLFKV